MEPKNGSFLSNHSFRPFLELGNYDQFLTNFWIPIFVYKNYTCIQEITKFALKLTVLWLDKIRDMIKFDGIDQLIKQMKEDEQIARDFKA